MTTKCNNHCMAHTRIGHDAASKCSVHHKILTFWWEWDERSHDSRSYTTIKCHLWSLRDHLLSFIILPMFPHSWDGIQCSSLLSCPRSIITKYILGPVLRENYIIWLLARSQHISVSWSPLMSPFLSASLQLSPVASIPTFIYSYSIEYYPESPVDEASLCLEE